MSRHLVLTIRLHDGRYHGMPVSEWPPSPARIFQALVAGVARGADIPKRFADALGWLERLPPPVIAAPSARLGAAVSLFVPNNDADAKGGDPARIAELRIKKLVRPHLIEGEPAVVYAWPLDEDERSASEIIAAADQVYQLGRGVDMAWGAGEMVDDDELTARLARHRGSLHRPTLHGGEAALPCPAPGSLASLVDRHRATRLREDGTGKDARVLFVNSPKPRFASVGYAATKRDLVFELRDGFDDTRPWRWPMHRAAELVERVRQAAAARLREALPSSRDDIDRAFLVSTLAHDLPPSPEGRIQLIPLPSIGHQHVDRAIRRLVVDVPDRSQISAADVAWAFAGLEYADPKTGEVAPFVLTRSSDQKMLDAHYRGPARRFRSVTPLVLPTSAKRRRIEPTRQRDEAKNATERIAEEQAAVAAVRSALRDAGVHVRMVGAHVQRDPFEARGVRAERFAPGSGFEKERMWHVDIELGALVRGPLVLGDGRFLGLGVMAPVARPDGVLAFRIAGNDSLDPATVARAMRRAVMSRVQYEVGNALLDRYFTGHEAEGGPAKSAGASHLAFHVATESRTILVFGPEILDRRHPSGREREHFDALTRAVEGMSELRVSRQQLLRLSQTPVDDGEQCLQTSQHWESAHLYDVNRHRKAGSAADAVAQDVIAECATRKLPRPQVEVLKVFAVPGRGLRGHVRLSFANAVQGPLVLGRSRYLGGGLFIPARAGHPTISHRR